jgi:purine nucleosidase
VSDRVRVVLDCDTANEVDDQIAVAYALGCPDLDVLGVVSVQNTLASGRDSVDRYVEEARRVVDLCGRTSEVACLRGADRPMETPGEGVPSEGLDFIVEQATTGPVTVLATGPATDIASLALLDAGHRSTVRVVWAGGFPDDATWQAHKYGELNARADIAAWRGLFGSDVPLVQLPGWPGVAKVAVAWREYVERLRGVDAAVTDYLAEIIQRWCAPRTSILDMDGARGDRKVLWDVVNVALLRNPTWVTLRRQALPLIDPAGAPDWTRSVRDADVGIDVDAEQVLADVWSALSTYAAPDPAA